MSDAPLLELNDLHVGFRGLDGRFADVVQGVDLQIQPGKTVGLVGESGSGKSVTAMSIMRLLSEPPARIRGKITLYQDAAPVSIDQLKPGGARMRQIRGNEIAMIFQEPMRALSPVFTVGHQIAEAVRLHRDVPRREAWDIATDMVDRVGIPDPARRVKEHPHQLSGGQLQRCMIAMALVCRPRLLIADEPTTALDVTIQAQILELLREMQSEFNLAILLITHDLGVVAHNCDVVNVMYLGRIVENAPTRDLFKSPSHPYTRGLLKSIPVPGQGHKTKLHAIPGVVPDPRNQPTACPFGPRCEHFQAGQCDQPQVVPPTQVESAHWSRCYLAKELDS